jgi:hypothetical protein
MLPFEAHSDVRFFFATISSRSRDAAAAGIRERAAMKGQR